MSTVGYINGTPLTHTSAAFNSVGSSTLVAFVSSHPSWNGLPVSISGLSDSAGNTWSVLTGPTPLAGSQFTLALGHLLCEYPYYQRHRDGHRKPDQSGAIGASRLCRVRGGYHGQPIFSAITDPGVGGTSASVMTAPIAVPTNSLLLSWVKNETSATATALGGYTLDTQQSTSFLWAEFETALSAGTYTGQFQYDSAIGWQTAIVGLKPPGSVVQPSTYRNAGQSDEPDQCEFQLHGYTDGSELPLPVGWQCVQRVHESGELFRPDRWKPHVLSESAGHVKQPERSGQLHLDHQHDTSADADNYFDASQSDESDQCEFQLHGYTGGSEFPLPVGWQRIQRVHESFALIPALSRVATRSQ